MPSSELLSFQPTELKFPCFPNRTGRLRRVEAKKQISCTLELKNPTEDYVAYKVKTTSPKKYSVRPNAGLVPPQGSVDIIITMQAQREYSADMHQCKDKFLVMSVRVPPGLDLKEAPPEMFNKEEGREIYENKLRVVIVPPPQPPSPVPESAEEGVSPTKANNGDWIFSLRDARKGSLDIENKIAEAHASLAMLSSERDIATSQSQQLEQELANASAPDSHETSPRRRGFSFQFVLLVGIFGLLVGYFLRR